MTATTATTSRSPALNATDESGTFACTFDLLPAVGGTQVRFHIVFPPMKGLNAVMFPLLFPIVAKPDFRKRLGLLNCKVESGQQPAGTVRPDPPNRGRSEGAGLGCDA